MKTSIKHFGLRCLMMLVLCFAVPMLALAAEKPAKITNCRINSNNKIEIQVTIEQPEQITGGQCYLFAKAMSNTGLSKSDKPIASATKAKTLTFRADLNSSTKDSLLYSCFLLAQKNASGQYEVISNESYISNPDQLAAHRYAFPTAVSKKGLAVSGNLNEDMTELNIRHSALNIVFTDMIAPKSEYNSKNSVEYKYHGKSYWFRKAAVNSYDTQMRSFKQRDVIVTAILLMGYRDDLTNLIYPGGRKKGKLFYAWNTANADSRETIQAALSFLAHRYSGASGSKGRIVNWIVGNEVNNRNYNYAGTTDLKQHCRIYAEAFRLTYNTVRSVYSGARVYISLDHIWNRDDVTATFAGRKVLDTFAAVLKSQGNIQWNLAYHPYGSPLTEPRFWANVNGQVTDSLTSPVINMANLSLLTNYIKQNYGSSTRIILSEQGYNSIRKTPSGSANVEKEQAAAIAYTYLLTESNDMVDSLILSRQIDHPFEVQQGLSLGLWTSSGSGSNPEWANKQKQSWNVYKYVDTNLSESVTKDLLSVIGIKNWKEVISNYSASLYEKVSITKGTMKTVKKYKKTAAIPTNWNGYGAVTKTKYKKGKFYLTHNDSRNRNATWGYEQSFGKGLNFSASKTFYTTVKIKGANNKKAVLKMRFYSGQKMLECQGVVSCNKAVKVGVSLANWKYKNNVTKISVLVSPYGSGKWKKASLEMTAPVM